MLYEVVNGLIFLYDNSFKCVHLCKEALIIDGENYKLMDTQLSRKVHPYLEILHKIPTKIGTYLAP